MKIKSKYIASDGSVAVVPLWFTGTVWREAPPYDPLSDRVSIHDMFACKEYIRKDYAYPENEEEARQMEAVGFRRSMQNV